MRLILACLISFLPSASLLAADAPNTLAVAPHKWSEAAAAQYLDQRANWWEGWPAAKRDHETVCISCHTMVPYALSRPKLQASLQEPQIPAPEASMLAYLKKRVSQWSEMQPYYLDESAGAGKSRESRATESVLNALVLASYDAGKPHLDPLTRTAFHSAWALQLKTGDNAGAWDWQVFHLAPWESNESQYQGATFMALAVGWAPDNYKKDPAIQNNLKALRSYLKREYAAQPLLNQAVLLWASGQLPGLLSRLDKQTLVNAIAQKQQADGGWSLSGLGPWVRSDQSPQETQSDGYATALITLALKQSKSGESQQARMQGQSWLESHQSKEGSWQASSLNKKRDPNTDVGRFMTDAATGYAVMALEATKSSWSGR